jgi:hypothetical protein
MFIFGRYGIGVPSIGHVSDGCEFMLSAVARIVRNNQVCQSQRQSYITTDSQLVSMSWCRAQSGTSDQRVFF